MKQAPIALAAIFALSACAPSASDNATGSEAGDTSDEAAFWSALSSHCGKAFAGTLVSKDEADADFAGRAMVMHVKECSDEQIAIPLHVETGEDGWDRSRTWLVTRTEEGLRLKHDHRHEDGSSDKVTMYGGDTVEDGTAEAQHFLVDPESIALFEAEGLEASVTNIWTMEVDPADADAPSFAYQLQRTKARGAPEDRLFRAEFDLSAPVDAPPAAWGHEGG
jgi:hypothetical protein